MYLLVKKTKKNKFFLVTIFIIIKIYFYDKIKLESNDSGLVGKEVVVLNRN